MSRKKKPGQPKRKRPVAQPEKTSKLKQGVQKILLSQMRWKYGSRIVVSLSTVFVVLLLFYGPKDRIDIVSQFIKKFSLDSKLLILLVIGILFVLFNLGAAKIIAPREQNEDMEV